MPAERLDDSRPCRLRGVAFVVPGFDAPGGMEGQGRRLARALAGQGVPITYVTTAPQGSPLPAREVLGLIEVFRVPVLTAVDWTTSLDLLELTCLGLLAARRERVEVVYSVHHTIGAVAARVGRALGAPVVVKLAGGGATGDVQTLLASPRRARYAAALRQAARLVAISDAIAAEARGLVGVPAERIVRIPNGVDLEAFKPAAPQGERVVFLGRLAREKRVDVLLDAFARVARERPAATLDLAGDGPERAALEARAARLGLGGRARFLGVVDDPAALLRGAAALALPSASEGLSNALLEAMASGVAVLATRIPGTDEVVRDGEEGLLVAPDDPAALGAALGRLLGDPALARRLGAAGRRRAEEAFDLEAVAERHALLFEGLKRERAGPARVSPPALARATLGALARTGKDATLSTARIVRGRVGRLARGVIGGA
ncbi:MAG: glycosyltransferase family 4 protein [Planctomycetes bacterium]|nr:glycosyltransferase family 4 protein [Planctomycetota bacterium]